MTKVEITIQDGKVTWVEQTGDQLPQELWNDFNVDIEELRKRFSKDVIREIVQKQTNLTCDAYQQGWQDCYDLFVEWLKERGIEL